MSQTKIPVEPVNVPIVSADINIFQCILNYGLKCIVYMYNEEGEVVKSQNIEIVGDEYNGWVSDDDLQILILSKCGLVKL